MLPTGVIKCPKCAELLQSDAKICKHCQADLEVIARKARAEELQKQEKIRSIKTVAISIAAICAILIGVRMYLSIQSFFDERTKEREEPVVVEELSKITAKFPNCSDDELRTAYTLASRIPKSSSNYTGAQQIRNQISEHFDAQQEAAQAAEAAKAREEARLKEQSRSP